ncbi:MAG: metallophosphoesterase, partial [Desulfobacterales bacterium]
INRLRIAQISDIHLGLMARQGRLNSILQKVTQANPDILVSTGDMLDGNVRHLPELAALLHQVPTPFGKYAVTGNHEFYSGIEDAIDFHHKAGFKLLNGEIKTIPGLINIAGVDDSPAWDSKPVDLLLSSAPRGLFTLFLKHRPDIEEKTLGHFDLQLSGHTHGGQIFLYNFLVSRSYSYLRGLFELSRGSLLYVNRGSGTWGPPMRLFTPPEITLIELVPKPVDQ